jgi:hypothetical protein
MLRQVYMGSRFKWDADLNLSMGRKRMRNSESPMITEMHEAILYG